MVKERRERTAGRAVGAAKMLRVVAGRRRKEAKSLEAIVTGVGCCEDGGWALAQLRVGSGVLKVEVQEVLVVCAQRQSQDGVYHEVYNTIYYEEAVDVNLKKSNLLCYSRLSATCCCIVHLEC